MQIPETIFRPVLIRACAKRGSEPGKRKLFAQQQYNTFFVFEYGGDNSDHIGILESRETIDHLQDTFSSVNRHSAELPLKMLVEGGFDAVVDEDYGELKAAFDAALMAKRKLPLIAVGLCCWPLCRSR